MSDISQRLRGVEEYYFSRKLQEIDLLNRSGKQIINLGIGSPDLPPHPDVISVLEAESRKANVHGYQSYKGSPVLRQAIAQWYQHIYSVSLDADTEILPLIGSKEGIMHICMTYLDPGDQALVPNPGYPTYRSAVNLAGAEAIDYLLSEERQWQPDFEALEKSDLSRVKIMFANYPHMPSGAPASPDLFQRLVDFGLRHKILIVHDNPYSLILNPSPGSILAARGAMETALELNSLSKSHNLAGWRIGMLCGAAPRIREVLQFKSNMDSGMFLPLQYAAAKALSLGPEWQANLDATYLERREIAIRLLEVLGCTYKTDQAGLFAWGRISDAQLDSYEYSDEILHRSSVFITPGGIFGSQGLQYLRISLCSKSGQLEEALQRVKLYKSSPQP